MPKTYSKEETDHSIDVNDINIHYNEAGSGPALICTHGGGPGANAWDNTKLALPYLAEHFRTILLDMPGFGGSQKQISRNGVPMDLFCATLQRDFMDRLGIDKAHLYGSSAFGGAALRFGIEFPDRIGKIIIQALRGRRPQRDRGPEIAGHLRSKSRAREHGGDDAPFHPARRVPHA